MQTLHQQRVEKFMKLAKQILPLTPEIPIASICELRASLILEEALETIAGLGCSFEMREAGAVNMENVEILSNYGEPDLVAIVDGCCDLMVVTTGTLSACGDQDHLVQEAVDLNNLAKFGPGSSLRADGKLIKPPDHQPPNIKGILDAQD